MSHILVAVTRCRNVNCSLNTLTFDTEPQIAGRNVGLKLGALGQESVVLPFSLR